MANTLMISKNIVSAAVFAVKASAGKIIELRIESITAEASFAKIFDGTPTLGTTVPGAVVQAASSTLMVWTPKNPVYCATNISSHSTTTGVTAGATGSTSLTQSFLYQ